MNLSLYIRRYNQRHLKTKLEYVSANIVTYELRRDLSECSVSVSIFFLPFIWLVSDDPLEIKSDKSLILPCHIYMCIRSFPLVVGSLWKGSPGPHYYGRKFTPCTEERLKKRGGGGGRTQLHHACLVMFNNYKNITIVKSGCKKLQYNIWLKRILLLLK